MFAEEHGMSVFVEQRCLLGAQKQTSVRAFYARRKTPLHRPDPDPTINGKHCSLHWKTRRSFISLNQSLLPAMAEKDKEEAIGDASAPIAQNCANNSPDYTLNNPDTLTKYKTAAQISQKVLEAVTGHKFFLLISLQD